MPDSHIRDERPERELGEQDDPTLTTRVGRPDGISEGSKPAAATAAEPPGRYWRNRAADLAPN